MEAQGPKRDFHHPYEPYEVQEQFMNAVYDCLEARKVGIFESPTGTGKSLSLICGSLTWLRDHKRQTFQEGLATDADEGEEPAWMLEHARKQKIQAALERRKAFQDRISKIKERERRVKERYQNGDRLYTKRRKTGADAATDDFEESHFVLDDYESDEEASKGPMPATFDEHGVSAATHALMEKLGYAAKRERAGSEEAVDETKVFFCSRTHSQLTQITSELRRVQLPPAISTDSTTSPGEQLPDVEEIKHVTLGSRKNLCIFPKVNKLRSATAINERCLELQQKGTSPDCRCPFMPTKETEAVVNDFRDHALAKVRDIEDLGSLGKELGICPYYASRPVVKSCEIVTLPYPSLLQKSAREALDLSLKDHVIIIDEAHNLMDAISGIHTISVTLTQVQQARMQLTIYLQKFRNKLKGKNRTYVAQIVRVFDSIILYLQRLTGEPKSRDGVVDMAALMSGKGVDQINLLKLNQYIQKSRLARKVDGYTVYADQVKSTSGGQEQAVVKSTGAKQTLPVLTHLQALLQALMNPSDEGKFFFTKEGTECITLRYMLLDPTNHFKEIVEEARSVILAGGTMSPMADYEQHLLSYLDPSRIMTLSCGHVIPPSNLLAVPVTQTVDGGQFDFTFEKRTTEKMMSDLGRAILAAIQHIPDGVVTFFPSYSYLEACSAAWKRLHISSDSGASTFWDALQETKPIFLEQSSQGSHPASDATKTMTVDSVLAAYSTAISSRKGRGALLFAVIGGSLSEGINFSDSLGRGVLVVGLPFPNAHSADWKAKMQYISAKTFKAGADGKAAAREVYENACMRAVNQSIGRAIRHRGDYAAIIMLDRRYGDPKIQAKLPKWIRRSLTNAAGVRALEQRLDDFFAGKP
ncbi:DNA repair helicase [Sporormia fimetaria CBS 119925]|uniref:ATP-dependent DNA helicase CHL1 n=1 Tax=Sporormia fimetaria CBS 119925 TaxID=1340428 RepID=A0A6A6V1N8_9PLEO|nr:DNA repair helicase [Sporormia fimetaria CBS 119925]